MAERTSLLLFPDLHHKATKAVGPPDAAARAEALDIRRSFVVEAPAGSGKTGLLIQRFLKLLGDETVTTPEQVLAITFTTKAAGEIRDRVLEHLAAARGGKAADGEFACATRGLAEAVLSRDGALGWGLLEQPRRLNVRTIDSVCAEIARSLPVLSGAGGGVTPTTEAEPLYREAARRTLLLLGTESEPGLDGGLRELLLHRDASLGDCETLLTEMLAVRDQWGALVPLDRASLEDAVLDGEVLPRLERALEQAICAELGRLCEVFSQDLLAEVADLAGHLGQAPGYGAEVSPLAPCAGIHTTLAAVAVDRDRWVAVAHLLTTKGGEWRKERGVTGKNLRFEYDRKHPHHGRLSRVLEALESRDDLLGELCRVQTLPPAKYPANQWAVAKSLFRVLRRALLELQLVFAERGQCDFPEVSLLARAALRNDAGRDDLQLAPGARLQHLLVDEMQDTSSGQYELLHLLTQSWDGHGQTVFLVGDPRQSIYMFRQARVERFVETMRTCRLGELPLTRLRLTANFRSQGRLVGEFNETFRAIFGGTGGDRADAMGYADADAVLPDASDGEGLRWHAAAVAVPPPSQSAAERTGPTGAQLRQRQARRNAASIRKIVQRWMTRPLPAGRREPWRLAVLVRNRNHLVEVSAALRADGVPFRAVEIEPLAERQEVLDLTALTRAVLHPGDRAAGLALLRAPWCGLSLADLHVLAGADDSSLRDEPVLRLMQQRGDLMSAGGCRRMQHLWTALTHAAAQRGYVPLAQLVERAWRTLGGDAALREDQRVNARRYFELLDELSEQAAAAGAALDTAMLERRLQRLYAEPQPVAEGQPFVELLTIHRAKGLEWDAVMIPALERRALPARQRLLMWAELDQADGGASVMLAPIAPKGEQADGLANWLRQIHREHEAAERQRLFYVAATRARNELHLFGSPDLSQQGQPRPWWDSLLKAAWAAAAPHFVAATPSAPQVAVQLQESQNEGLELAAVAEVMEIPSLEASATTVLGPEAAEEPLYTEPIRPGIERLPESFDPTVRFAAARERSLRSGAGLEVVEQVEKRGEFARPEGSLAARGVGNAVHALLEVLTLRLVGGASAGTLLGEMQGWRPRILALLRAEGLAPAEAERHARTVRTALESALRDRDGLWLLGAHRDAASELAMTAVQSEAGDAALLSVRLDRVFLAGEEPHGAGDDCLWIVDYKTAAHSGSGLERFLNEQRGAYAGQLQRYARVLASARGKALAQVRVALYYPMLPQLVWWVPGETQS